MNEPELEPSRGSAHDRLAQTLVDLEAARDGDRDAANRLWDRYYEKLVPAVRIRLGPKLRNKVETLDILQSVFLEALGSTDERRFPTEGHFRAWLSKLVENRIRKKARYFGQQRRNIDREQGLIDDKGEEQTPAGAPQPRPVSLVEQFDQFELMERALERLPHMVREVLVMRYFDELSYADIGQRLERSEEAARKLVNRAVSQLAREMGR